MGNYYRSPATIAREDVKSSNFSSHDHDKKDRSGTSGAAQKKIITILTNVEDENIEEKYLVDKELGRSEFSMRYLCIDWSSRELLACKSILKHKLRTMVDMEDMRKWCSSVTSMG